MKNPIKDEKDYDRVYRGGSWFGGARVTRVLYRSNYDPAYTRDSLGFRLVKNIPRIRNEKSNKR